MSAADLALKLKLIADLAEARERLAALEARWDDELLADAERVGLVERQEAAFWFGPDDVLARYAACDPLTDADADVMTGRIGIPAHLVRRDEALVRVHGLDHLARPESAPMRRASVIFDGANFDFPDEAQGSDMAPAAAIVIVCYEHGTPVDLLAIRLAPFAAASWLGRVAILGEDDIAGQARVRVFRTPIDWLRGGCDGVVILNTGVARDRLAGKEVVAQDVEHGRWLKNALSFPPPRILVSGATGGAA